jgi:hypothetical protein
MDARMPARHANSRRIAMHSSHPHLRLRNRLRAGLLAALLITGTVQAGPPLLCHPFDTNGAASLPWGKGWNQPDRRYDTARLAVDTLGLLDPNSPVIARMETLRRAAIYASADGATLRTLHTALERRIVRAETPRGKALAMFDAGYFAETLQDLERLQGYDMPGVGKVELRPLQAVLAGGNGSIRIAQALALLPDEPALRFAAALVAAADERKADYNTHARLARAGAPADALLARNIAQVAARY